MWTRNTPRVLKKDFSKRKRLVALSERELNWLRLFRNLINQEVSTLITRRKKKRKKTKIARVWRIKEKSREAIIVDNTKGGNEANNIVLPQDEEEIKSPPRKKLKCMNNIVDMLE